MGMKINFFTDGFDMCHFILVNACAVYADDFELTPKNKLLRSRPLNCNLHFRKPCQNYANLMSGNFVIMMIFVTYYDSFMYKKVFG